MMKFYIWDGVDKDKDFSYYKDRYSKIKDLGFDGVLPCVYNSHDAFFKNNVLSDNKNLLEDILLPLVKSLDLELHAWFMTMRLTNKKMQEEHPDWFAISREGFSTLEKKPYVDYYTWLCPSKAGVKRYLLDLFESLASIKDLDGIHLDYIRHCDIILPSGLQGNYKLKQNKEMAEFDYCYCDECKREFERRYNYKIQDKSEDEIIGDQNWKFFRSILIKEIVDTFALSIKSKNKKLSAAVFPSPKMSFDMVRQKWDDWDIDAFFPMIYHGFYEKDIYWIKEKSIEDLNLIKGKELYTGIFIPSFKSKKELEDAIYLLKDTGINGISFFDFNSLSEEILELSKKIIRDIKSYER